MVEPDAHSRSSQTNSTVESVFRKSEMRDGTPAPIDGDGDPTNIANRGARERVTDPGCSPIDWCFGFPGFSPRPSFPQRSRRDGFFSRNSLECLLIPSCPSPLRLSEATLSPSIVLGRPSVAASRPTLMAELPLDKAYLTAIWLETLFYGTPVQWRCLERDLTSLVFRHQLYALLDLWLCPLKEKEQNSVDYASCGHFPVDAFYCSCVARLYRAYMLFPANTSVTRILTGLDTAIDLRIHLRPRPARRSCRLFLRHFHSWKRCQSLHSYSQCKPPQSHCSYMVPAVQGLIFDFVT